MWILTGVALLVVAVSYGGGMSLSNVYEALSDYDKLMTKADSDGDGGLNATEFSATLTSAFAKDLAVRLYKRLQAPDGTLNATKVTENFNLVDSDDNNQVTKREVLSYITNCRKTQINMIKENQKGLPAVAI